jgi:glucokinase
MILAGDIGGTKTLLRLAEVSGTSQDMLAEQRYVSADWGDLTAMVQAFLDDVRREHGEVSISGACFGIAGPVSGRQAWVTNLPWELDADAMQSALDIPKVRLINDFAAVGYGIEALGNDDLVTLQAGEPEKHGPCALIGAGTGLGEGILVWAGDHYEVMASEGGHVEFAPRNALQVELLEYLMPKFGHVSCERVCCGRGLVNIFEFLRDTGKGKVGEDLEHAMQSGDPAAAISMAALANSDVLASQAMDIFVDIYGAQAGNLGLTCLATGGVYVAGGIAPKIIDRLTRGDFTRAFNDKGRMQKLTEPMPVRVVTNAHVGLLGAVLAASRL